MKNFIYSFFLITIFSIMAYAQTKEIGAKMSTQESLLKEHEVQPKETLYGISKKYNVTLQDLENKNKEILKDGVKAGQILIIPSDVKLTAELKNAVYHEVKAKETKFSISKLYNITIEQLEKANPSTLTGLQIGDKLIIPEAIKVEKPIEKPIVKTPKSDKVTVYLSYTVKAKETLYSLCNQFGLTPAQLAELNPEIDKGVQEGMVLKVPGKAMIITKSLPAPTNHAVESEIISVKSNLPVEDNANKKIVSDLTKSLKRDASKKIALLLPFNLNKIEKDTVNSTASRLKKDKLLSMTLDFYAGALIAIDSVKKMNLDIDITILDSNETRNTSNIASLIQDNNLKLMNAIIGPFYQDNAEKTAELLASSNIPVISPLSKAYEKSFSNLIQATPTPEIIKNSMFEYIRNVNGNAIAIVDPKKAATKQYLINNQKEVVFANVSEKGILNVDDLKSLLVKDKVNYVILETQNTSLILNTTSALIKSLGSFQIKLVMLDDNDALDNDEIPMSSLTKLRMHYPSQTRVNESKQAIIFKNKFKKANKVLPNLFATKGFDVTFDVIMRLFQDKYFTETINQNITEQVENKFNYIPIPEGGYINKGSYILYYDIDMTIKAN